MGPLSTPIRPVPPLHERAADIPLLAGAFLKEFAYVHGKKANAISPAAQPKLVGMSIEQAERELIKNTLASLKGNRVEAAKVLGIGERTLYRKIKEYGLQ